MWSITVLQFQFHKRAPYCTHLLAHDKQGAQLTIRRTGTIGTRGIRAGKEMQGAAEEGKRCSEVELVLKGVRAQRTQNTAMTRRLGGVRWKRGRGGQPDRLFAHKGVTGWRAAGSGAAAG